MKIIEEHLRQWHTEEYKLTRKSSNLLFWLNMLLFPFGTPVLGYMFQEPASTQMNIIVGLVMIASVIAHILEKKYEWKGTIYIHIIYLLTFATLGYIAAVVQNKLLITIYVLANITNYIAGAVVVFWKTSHSFAVCIYSLLLNFLMFSLFSTHTIDNYVGLWALVIPVAGCSVALNWFKYNPFKANFLMNIQLAAVNGELITKQHEISRQNLDLQRQQREITEQNYILQAKQDEIESQNEELHQQQEEITAQRDALNHALQELHKKSEDVTSSINYARRIQKALLPTREDMIKFFPEHFVFFRARDIVSGDFFWFVEKDNMGYIAAADCTGHGVPGAFMSMIGVEMLNEIVNTKNATTPATILTLLNSGVTKALKQAETDNKDGMDIALCVVDKQSKTVQYAGAMNPLYYVCQDELHEIKATKRGIGGHQGYGAFAGYENHTLTVTAPTTFYLFSDGYADQFGGKENKKFMSRNMKNLFLQIWQQPALDQKEVLKQTMLDWMGVTHKQIDDILVMGFKME